MINFSISDIETDGLNPTKIHCISSYQVVDGKIVSKTYTDYQEMREFILSQVILVGHNFSRYDIPAIERILGIKVRCRVIDTLALSWYLYPERNEHGLASWGVELGFPKPPIEDWQSLPLEEYINRCESDVIINTRLFRKQFEYLMLLYNNDEEAVLRLCDYLAFKMNCAREQEEIGWKLDIEKAKQVYEKLLSDYTEKYEILSDAMPPNKKYAIRKRPKVMFKKDGELSSHGQKWLEKISLLGLSEDIGELKEVVKEERANPGSPDQVKSWLFSLGWEPITFKYPKGKDPITGEEITKKVEQVNIDGDLCSSVKALISKEPAIKILEGITILKDRIGIVKRFLDNVDENGMLQAAVQGFTNTLRFKHTIIVNLPTIHKPYGSEIRGCLIANEGQVLCGSDMSSLEDNTKRHYMYFYDPDYVEQMKAPGFSAHLDIGVQGDMITQGESDFYVWYEARKDKNTFIEELFAPKIESRFLSMSPEAQQAEFKRINGIRKDSKQVNFACVYGAGPPKIVLTSGMPLATAVKLHTVYWKRNWSVKQIAKDCTVKTVNGQMWLWNPVSHFWYTLRFDKDKFSTLNQGTGVYCFDTWVANVRSRGIKICGQFHDEIISPTNIGEEDRVSEILRESIEKTNEQLKLNVKLGISIDFGHAYSDIH